MKSDVKINRFIEEFIKQHRYLNKYDLKLIIDICKLELQMKEEEE